MVKETLGIVKLDASDLDRLQKLLEGGRETIKEAREVIAELRVELKEYDRKKNDIKALLATYDNLLPAHAKQIEGMLGLLVATQIDALAVSTEKAMHESVQRILDQFQRLSDIIFAASKDKPSLEEIANLKKGSVFFTRSPEGERIDLQIAPSSAT